MHAIVRPVSIGLVLGLLTLVFGLFWAVFLMVHHERIHDYLAGQGKAAMQGNVATDNNPAADAHSHHEVSGNDAHSSHHAGTAALTMAENEDSSHGSMQHGGLMGLAHERLTRGHIHAMGLGLIAIAVSLIAAFLNVSNRVKAAASACVGAGGLFYPFAWVIMGFRTVTLGAQGAEDSVIPIIALSVALVLIGIIITLAALIKGVWTAD